MTPWSARASVFLAAALLLALPPSGFAAPLKLGPTYYGTYTPDVSGQAQSFTFELEKRKGNHYDHVAFFGMNLPEFLGDGDVVKKKTEFRCRLHATGLHANHISLVATIGSGGDSLSGTYEIRHWYADQKPHYQPIQTGSFSVSR